MRYLAIIFVTFVLFVIQDTAELFNSDMSGHNFKIDNSVGDNECTILVISGGASADNRPILWKNRDVTNPDQKYYYIPPCSTSNETTYAYLGNFYANDLSRCFMGINEKGFGIINANCYNLSDMLSDGIDDGDLMRIALQTCCNVDEWEELLARTNLIGRKDAWMFGVLDAAGSAKLFECTNFSYYVYDANDLEQTPDGIIVRSVYSLRGWYTDKGINRYKRANQLVRCQPENRLLTVEYILQTIARDFQGPDCNPYPLPFYGQLDTLPVGYVNTFDTINRFKTRSCSVIRGVLPNEDPLLATTYAMLGPPVLSIAVPLWVGSEGVPAFLNHGATAPWLEIIGERMENLYPDDDADTWMNTHCLLDSAGEGSFSYIFGLEKWAIAQADSLVEFWSDREHKADEMRNSQNEICQVVWDGFLVENDTITRVSNTQTCLPDNINLYNYPNPFNQSTTISFYLSGRTISEFASVSIYNILGEKVMQIGDVKLNNGRGTVDWNGCNDSGCPVSTGIYFYRIEVDKANYSSKMLMLK